MRVLLVLWSLLAASSTLAADIPQVLILDLQRGEEIPASIARTLTDLITVEASNERAIKVVSGSELRSLAELEGEKAAAGCDDNSCLAELAGALGARFVISGRIATIGELKVLQLSLFDAAAAVAIGRKAISAKDYEELVTQLPTAVRELLRGVAPLLQREAAAQNAKAAPNSALTSPVGKPSGPATAAGPLTTDSRTTGPRTTSPRADASQGAPADLSRPRTNTPNATPQRTASTSPTAAPVNPYHDPVTDSGQAEGGRTDGGLVESGEGGGGAGAMWSGGILVALGSVVGAGALGASLIGASVFFTKGTGDVTPRYVGGVVGAGGALVAGTAAIGVLVGAGLFVSGIFAE